MVGLVVEALWVPMVGLMAGSMVVLMVVILAMGTLAAMDTLSIRLAGIALTVTTRGAVLGTRDGT